MARAVLSLGRLGGGSTITQQVVKNALLSPSRTLSRKAAELYLSLVLEQHMAKHDILGAHAGDCAGCTLAPAGCPAPRENAGPRCGRRALPQRGLLGPRHLREEAPQLPCALPKRLSVEEQRFQKNDRFLRGRQTAYMIYEHFRANGAYEALQGLTDLFIVRLQNDDVQDFDVR